MCSNSLLLLQIRRQFGHLQMNIMQVKVLVWFNRKCVQPVQRSQCVQRKCHAYNAHTIQMFNSTKRINVINRVGEAKRTEPNTTYIYSRRLYCIHKKSNCSLPFHGARVCVYIIIKRERRNHVFPPFANFR